MKRYLIIVIVVLFFSGLVSFAATEKTLYVKGLVMIDITNPDIVRLCLPSTPNHQATLSITSLDNSKQILTIKGNGKLTDVSGDVTGWDGKRREGNTVTIPSELIRMKEIYGNSVKTKLDNCPSVIDIPAVAIKSIDTSEVSEAKYTFIRVDTKNEVTSFRPRKVAMELKLSLVDSGTLFINGKNFPLSTLKELHLEYLPKSYKGNDAFVDHFHSYLSYIERPAALDFEVVPKNLNYKAVTPKAGNSFAPLDNIVFCYLIAVP